MEYDAVHERFLALESDLDPFSKRIDGVPFWERVRFDVHKGVLEEVSGFENAHSSPVGFQRARLRKLATLVKHSIVRNPFLGDSPDIAFLGHPRRKQRDDGYWWDVYCDPIIERLDAPSLSLERPYHTIHYTPPKTESLRYLDPVIYGGSLRRKFAPPDVLSDEDREYLSGLEAEFEEAFDAPVDIVDRVELDLVTRRCRRPLYRALFERLDPDLVVVVVSYVLETPIEVCKELSIPVAELQHGVINPYHIGYSYPGDREKRAFPDHLLTFGEFWGESVELPIPPERVHSVGYPYLESTAPTDSGPVRDRAVIVSQGTIGTELSKFAVDLAEQGTFEEVVYKLHPGEYDGWREAYPWLVDAPLDVRTDADLYELFATSRAQIGVYSTALYEGLYFDLDTYLVDLPGVSQLRPLLEYGAATLVDSPAELLDRAGSPNSSVGSGVFFEPDAVENTLEVLAAIRNGEHT